MLRTITRQMLTSGHKVAAGSQRIAASPFVGSQRAYSVSATDPNDPDDNASFFEMVSLFYEKGKHCALMTQSDKMSLVCMHTCVCEVSFSSTVHVTRETVST